MDVKRVPFCNFKFRGIGHENEGADIKYSFAAFDLVWESDACMPFWVLEDQILDHLKEIDREKYHFCTLWISPGSTIVLLINNKEMGRKVAEFYGAVEEFDSQPWIED